MPSCGQLANVLTKGLPIARSGINKQAGNRSYPFTNLRGEYWRFLTIVFLKHIFLPRYVFFLLLVSIFLFLFFQFSFFPFFFCVSWSSPLFSFLRYWNIVFQSLVYNVIYCSVQYAEELFPSTFSFRKSQFMFRQWLLSFQRAWCHIYRQFHYIEAGHRGNLYLLKQENIIDVDERS